MYSIAYRMLVSSAPTMKSERVNAITAFKMPEVFSLFGLPSELERPLSEE